MCSDTVISYLMSSVAWAASLKTEQKVEQGAGLEKAM